jgi:hypothetical protein
LDRKPIIVPRRRIDHQNRIGSPALRDFDLIAPLPNNLVVRQQRKRRLPNFKADPIVLRVVRRFRRLRQ